MEKGDSKGEKLGRVIVHHDDDDDDDDDDDGVYIDFRPREVHDESRHDITNTTFCSLTTFYSGLAALIIQT